jgi:sulfide dehydrogenase [flavocytochrome c] flavoprotein subunit
MKGLDMYRLSRRRFLSLAGYSAALGLAGLPLPGSSSTYKARVIVVGGGYGGATAAKYLRLADPHIEVLLIERNPRFVSCALSNEVLAGERTMESLTFGYQALTQLHGVKVLFDEVTEIDSIAMKLSTVSGEVHGFDRVVVAPGVDFKWEKIDGYNEAAAEVMPHAWYAGEQTLLLRSQLDAMPDGGRVYISAPPNPYKCPPGPYERAALIAHYLKRNNKGKSKIIILDAKEKFPKQALFQQGWEHHYPGMIEWVPASGDGTVLGVDSEKGILLTEFSKHQGDVMNVIPPQRAGKIAHTAGLTDQEGWCPVDQQTFESTQRKNVHVIGDACIAGKMPKSGYSANTQAKVCAAAIAALINGTSPPEPSYANTCYSIIAPEHGISVSAIYKLDNGHILPVEGAGGVSPMDASSWERKMEATYARSWFANITADIFS